MNLNEMQVIVNQFFTNAGINHHLIIVEETKKTVAYAIGGCIRNVEGTLLRFLFQGSVAGGLICINPKAVKHTLNSEIRFILAHESAHIMKNHVVTSTMWHLAEEYLKGEQHENEFAIEMLKAILALISKDSLPPNAVTLRDQEYEADAEAVRMTGDQQSAISCLTKLVKGDMNAPSHVWELFGKGLPAMTMGQRIAELKRRTDRFFPSFPSFPNI